MHRDLKPHNILLAEPVRCHSDPVHAKVCDFGLARWSPNATVGRKTGVEEACSGAGSGAPMLKNVGRRRASILRRLTLEVGSPAYMAPELAFTDLYSEKVDVFSYGIVLHFLLAGEDGKWKGSQPSFSQCDLEERRPSLDAIPKDAPSVFSVLMQLCWQNDPSHRPSFMALRDTLRESYSRQPKRTRRSLDKMRLRLANIRYRQRVPFSSVSCCPFGLSETSFLRCFAFLGCLKAARKVARLKGRELEDLESAE